MRVERLFNLGSTQIAMAAMQRGNIDCYPEYTGTALIDVLHLAADRRSARARTRVVSRLFEQRYGIVWLAPSPMNDSQALATTRAHRAARSVSRRSPTSRAPRRICVSQRSRSFSLARTVCPGCSAFYGGFRFREVRTYDIALKYRALLDGKADVASAFTHRRRDRNRRARRACATTGTSGRRITSRRSFARAALAARPQIARVLNAVSPAITDRAAQAMNAAVEKSQQDPADVAAAFLSLERREDRSVMQRDSIRAT